MRYGCTISQEKQHKLECSLGYESNTWEVAKVKSTLLHAMMAKRRGQRYMVLEVGE